MDMGFFNWWAEQSPWLRYGVALILIAISTIILLAGRIWIWGWVAGVILLLFAGPSSSEKKGYRF
jgi:hypothetical protein